MATIRHKKVTIRRAANYLRHDVRRTGKERLVVLDKRGKVLTVSQGNSHSVRVRDKDFNKAFDNWHTSLHSHPGGWKKSISGVASPGDIEDAYLKGEREGYVVNADRTVCLYRRPRQKRYPKKETEANSKKANVYARKAKKSLKNRTPKTYVKNVSKGTRLVGATFKSPRKFALLKKASPMRRRSAVRR